MKKFNLFNEIIVVNKTELLNALSTKKSFAINKDGKILFAPYADKEIFIYEGLPQPQQNIGIATQKPLELESVLGKDYKVVVDDDRVLIKAALAWQSIIRMNMPRASYDDTTGDGISEFSHSKLEDIGWHATEFHISYREIVEEIEAKCEGTLLCIEQAEPYQFSGLGFIDNEDKAAEVAFAFCQSKIKEMMQNDEDYRQEKLTDDEEEAAEFFKAI